MPRLPRALAVSLALHFLIVLSLAMIRAGKARDRFPEPQMVDLVSPGPSPHAAAPLPAEPPPLPSSEAPSLPAGSVPLEPAAAAPPLPSPAAEAPAPAAPEAPPPPVEEPRAEPPPPPPTAEAMAPVTETPPTPPQAPPPPAPAQAAAPALPPGVPGGDPRAAAMAACRFAQRGAPVAADLLRQMFPRELFAEIPWGRGRVLVRWLPDGSVAWDVEGSNARLVAALNQVHWQRFPHPGSFRLPNRAVTVDVEISGGELLYRVNPA